MAIIHNISHATVLLAGSLLLLNATPALANPACGETLTGDITLLTNMTCPDTAIHFNGKASRNVTLDCVGRSISVDNGAAIIADNTSGVTIRNCVIATNNAYAHGILFRNGTRNSRVQANAIFTAGFASRGIELRQSSRNTISDNSIDTSGTSSSGLSLRSGSDKNQVKSNTFRSIDAFPIRIESSSKNKITDNRLISLRGYLIQRTFPLQNGGMGTDSAGNIYAVENNWGSKAGIGTTTSFFMVDPLTGEASGMTPVRKGKNKVKFGFDALEVLPNGRIMALPGPDCCEAPTLFEINPANGKLTPWALNLADDVDGKLNGLDASGDSSLLATTNLGELLNIDLDSGDVTEIGQQETGWTDVAVHPTNSRAYAVSRRSAEATGTAHLYEIDPVTGQVIVEIGDTGQVSVSSIDFALNEILYGNGVGGLVTIDTGTGSATVQGSLGPDPLEPFPRKNRLKNNHFETEDGSIAITAAVIIPSKLETVLKAEWIDIFQNQARIDASMLPFLDEKARITLHGVAETYLDLLVDHTDQGNFNLCKSPKCKFVSHEDETLVFDVKGFTTYSSQVNADPTLSFISILVMVEVKKLLKEPGISNSARKKLRAALKDLEKGIKFANRDNARKGLSEIAKSVIDLLKAGQKIEGIAPLIEHLTLAAQSEAQAALAEAIALPGDPTLIAEAQDSMVEAQGFLDSAMPQEAISAFQHVVAAALKALETPQEVPG